MQILNMAEHHTDNTSPTLCVRTALYITPQTQTLNSFNFRYFIISYFCTILFYIIIQKQNCNRNYIYSYYYGMMVTRLTAIIFLYDHPEDARPDYWPKRVGEHIINKNTS